MGLPDEIKDKLDGALIEECSDDSYRLTIAGLYYVTTILDSEGYEYGSEELDKASNMIISGQNPSMLDISMAFQPLEDACGRWLDDNNDKLDRVIEIDPEETVESIATIVALCKLTARAYFMSRIQ